MTAVLVSDAQQAEPICQPSLYKHGETQKRHQIFGGSLPLKTEAPNVYFRVVLR